MIRAVPSNGNMRAVPERRDLGFCELSFEKRPELVSIVRRFVSDFYDRTLADPDATSRVALATHELLENAVEESLRRRTGIRLSGSAGQSFGAFIVDGMRLELEGEANDYVAKGMSGGEIAIRPPRVAPFVTPQAIAGNTVLYGATGGHLFLAGRAGERFGVRNSGATAVVDIRKGPPPIVNPEREAGWAREAAERVLGDGNVVPFGVTNMGGEDFACYLERIGGCFLRIGAREPGGEPAPAHSPRFNAAEESIFVGAAVLAECARVASERL